MKKMILRGLAALTLLIGAASVGFAQAPGQLPELPQDPELRIGKLDNGLTYYIRHNETPKGQADFYIAQKVGSILEEENQRGLAHFLEHMCFNGTTNFPGKQIIDWLESVGVAFGDNLNAVTSIDETIYNISNVPVARKSVQDSCLMILHDWACEVTLDPAEIDAERGVIHEEWRQSMAGQMRIFENQLPKLFPDNRYGERLPIGTMEVVDNFPPQAIVDYYHKWYRPDLQGIIVVGDIDVDYIEGKIKEIFSTITMPENAAEREYLPIDDTDETIVAIGTDKEMQMPVVLYFAKNDNALLPREYRNTQAFFPVEFMRRMAQMMLNNRLAELANQPETEFANARMSIGEFFVAKTKGAVTLQVVAKDTDIVPAFAQAYRELTRAAKTGFTVGEFERAKAQFLAMIDKQYEERANRENDSYSQEYVNLFIDNEPAPGIEFEKQMYDQLSAMIKVENINEYFSMLLSDDDNRALLAMLPDSPNFPVPTEQQFLDVIGGINDEDLEPYKDEMREDPLIPSLPAAGKVLGTQQLTLWNATEYTLSNGAKVIVKPTAFKNNQIVFEAVAKGKGTSTLNPADAPSVLYMGPALQNMSLNDYTNSDLTKYLQGKVAALNFSMDAYTRQASGETTVKDLPVLMELLYSFFTGFGLDEKEFAANQAALAGILANQENNPQFIFSQDLMKALFKTPLQQALTAADIKAANRQTIIDIVKNAIANAADYTFVFVGQIDPETFIPLMEQYLGTLPADAATATTGFTLNPEFGLPTGVDTNVFTTAMETPQTWMFVGTFANMPFNTKNKVVTSVAAQVLSKRLLNKIREEMGATYSIGCSANMSRTAELNTVFQVAAPIKPEEREAVLAEIHTIFENATKDVTPDEIKPAIEYMAKTLAEDKEKNDEWASNMTASMINDIPTWLETEAILPTITVEDVQNFLRAVLDQNNYRVILLNPEEKAAE